MYGGTSNEFIVTTNAVIVQLQKLQYATKRWN